jgi:glycosyltransferase involved in cell wall biosynthesis
MRLVYVVNDGAFFLSHRLELAVAAAANGYDVHVIIPDSVDVRKIEAAGFTTHTIPLSRSGLNPLAEWQTLRALKAKFRVLQPDILHLLTIKPVIYGAIAARNSREVKIVCGITGLGHIFTGETLWKKILRFIISRLYRLAFSHEDLTVIFQNEDDLRLFRERRFITDSQTRLIRGSGVDPERFAALPEPQGVPIVILASRMLWNKGVGTFVEAAKKLQENGITVRMVLAGKVDDDNPEGVPLEKLQNWNDAKIVEWWGNRTDMPHVLSQASIVCLPSYYREGVPKALIEAASCGRAIVTTDMPGCRDIVRHQENGILIPPEDAGALAEAIMSLLDDPTLRSEMGRIGRQMVIDDFSLEQVVESTLSVYTPSC